MTGDEFKEMRTRAGVSITQAARGLYVTEGTIRHMESGRVKVPAARVALFRARFLGQPLEEYHE